MANIISPVSSTTYAYTTIYHNRTDTSDITHHHHLPLLNFPHFTDSFHPLALCARGRGAGIFDRFFRKRHLYCLFCPLSFISSSHLSSSFSAMFVLTFVLFFLLCCFDSLHTSSHTITTPTLRTSFIDHSSLTLPSLFPFIVSLNTFHPNNSHSVRYGLWFAILCFMPFFTTFISLCLIPPFSCFLKLFCPFRSRLYHYCLFLSCSCWSLSEYYSGYPTISVRKRICAYLKQLRSVLSKRNGAP